MRHRPSRRARELHAAARVPLLTRASRSIEPLEGRKLLAAVSWDGGAGTLDWNDAANWSTNALPTSSDDVTITVAASNPTITVSTGDQSVKSLTSNEAISISGGSLSVSAASSITALTLSGGSLGGSGDVVVTGGFGWTDGRMDGSGRTIARGGATLAAGGNYYDTLTLGVGRTLRLESNATLAKPYDDGSGGTGYPALRGEDNYGPGGPASRIELAAGKTLTLLDAAGLGWFSGDAAYRPVLSIESGATLTHSGPGQSQVNFVLQNSGTVNLSSGTLYLAGGGVSNTTVSVPAATTLRLGGGFSFGGSGGLSGAGNVEFVDGTHTFAGNFAITSPITISNANVIFNANQTLAALTLSGGSLGGSGDVVVTGGFGWTDGRMDGSGRTIARGGATLAAGGNYYDTLTLGVGRTLRLESNATLAKPYDDGSGGTGYPALRGEDNYGPGGPASRIELAAGKTLTLLDAAGLGWFSGDAAYRPVLSIESGATLTHSGPGQSQVNFVLQNSGTVNLSSGSLVLGGTTNIGSGTFLSAGHYFVADGTTLTFTDPVTTLAAELDITGSGIVNGLSTLTTNRGRIGLNDGADFITTPSGGTFYDEGIIDLAPGSIFAVHGNMRLAGVSQPIVRVELASASSFGKLSITGSLDLNSPDSTSRFDPDLVDGYNPAPGSRHDVIVANGGITNAFDTFFGGPTPSNNTLLALRPTPNVVAVGVGTGAPPPAPQILSETFDFATRQALVFTFNQDVSAFLSRKDYSVKNLTTGQTLAQTAGTLSYNQTSNQAVLTLTGVLPDGNYRLSIQAGDVANSAGVPLTSPLTFDFFVLAGDANRDRVVNFSDLLILAKHYGQKGLDWASGNFDYSSDGAVDFNDLLILAKNYSKSLAVPPPAATLAPAASLGDATSTRNTGRRPITTDVLG